MGAARIFHNPAARPLPARAADRGPLRFHATLPGYAPTPLVEAPRSAAALGVGRLLVKDESARLGMPSFKILGASWAIFRALCAHADADPEGVGGMDGLKTLLAQRPPLELVAATDGNHGRAVARMAKLLGLSAHVFVPTDLMAARVAAIESEGARVTVVDGSYDEAVASSASVADVTHLVISDTSWPGYEQIPAWVIEGYSTIGLEVDTQLRALSLDAPAIVAAQVGVGAFASAVVRHFRPQGAKIVSVEPTRADCAISSIEAGRILTVRGPHDSIMVGLNCGRPSLIAWPMLKRGIDAFVAIDDDLARQAMRLLARDGIISGESGAAGLAGLLDRRRELGLHRGQTVLTISTEGATDPIGYAAIIGSAPKEEAA